MKVALLNTSDHGGGAAIAAFRLMEALRATDTEAHLLVRSKQSADPSVVALDSGAYANLCYKTAFVAERALLYGLNGFDRAHLFEASLANTGRSLVHHPLIQEADIIHLHWINQGFLSLRQIEALARLGKPLVWTMHDMWPFSAALHYTGGAVDERGIERCAERGLSLPYGLLRRQMRRKAQVFEVGHFTMVGCSEWIANAARRSPLAKHFAVTSIPNPIDTERFSPADKEAARRSWGFSPEEQIILFGAVNTSDPRKGAGELVESLRLFAEQYGAHHPRVRVVIFGYQGSSFVESIPLPVTQIGFVREAQRMIELYRAADIYVTPSLEDNLPNTIMEAMSVGLPVVGFATGGIPEMIAHCQTGYVASYQSATSFAEGIHYTLGEEHDRLSTAARAKSVACYDQKVIGQRFRILYEMLLAGGQCANFVH